MAQIDSAVLSHDLLMPLIDIYLTAEAVEFAYLRREELSHDPYFVRSYSI